MLAFLSSPKQYAKATGFPDKFPAQRAGKETFDLPPSAFEYQGYCPVTLFDGPPDLDSIVCGRTDLVAEYNGKLYAMLDEEKLEKFMRKPTLYAEQKLRESLPPRKSDTPLTDLPMYGEEWVSFCSFDYHVQLTLPRLKSSLFGSVPCFNS